MVSAVIHLNSHYDTIAAAAAATDIRPNAHGCQSKCTRCDAWPPSLPLSLANCIWSIYRVRTRRNKIIWMTSNKQHGRQTKTRNGKNVKNNWPVVVVVVVVVVRLAAVHSIDTLYCARASVCVCVCVDGRERVRPCHAQKFRWPYGCHTVSHLIEINYERITSAGSH